MFRLLIGCENDSGEKKEHQGLLSDFLREKAESYVGATRVGTPRGEPVGLSEQKYAATLLALTSFDGKKTAKTLGVSYGLLRKWRTEPFFKKTVDKHAKEFIERFSRHIKDSIVASDQKTNAILALSPAAIAKTQIVNPRIDAFTDGILYGDDLFYRLMVATWPLIKKKNKNDRDLVVVQVDTICAIDLIEKRRGGRRSSFLLEELRAKRIPFYASVIRSAVDTLTLPKPTAEQRKSAIFKLTMVAQALEAEDKQSPEKSSK